MWTLYRYIYIHALFCICGGRVHSVCVDGRNFIFISIGLDTFEILSSIEYVHTNAWFPCARNINGQEIYTCRTHSLAVQPFVRIQIQIQLDSCFSIKKNRFVRTPRALFRYTYPVCTSCWHCEHMYLYEFSFK